MGAFVRVELQGSRQTFQHMHRDVNIPSLLKPCIPLGAFFSLDMAASSALTQQRLGWHPVEPALLADLDQDHYFKNEM